MSAGNLLYLRELTTAAAAAGALGRHRGRWMLRGPLPTSPSLTELVEDRLGARAAGRGAVLAARLAEAACVADPTDLGRP